MKHFIAALLALTLALGCAIPALPRAAATEARLEAAMEWAVQTAEDDSCGYDRWDRFGPNYDCSSFVSTALMEGGFPLGGCLSSATICRRLEEQGFVRYNRGEVQLRRGDVLVNPGTHVELYLGDDRCVAAHQDYDGRSGDSTGKEIQIRSLDDCPFCKYGQYRYVLRWLPEKPAQTGDETPAQ